MTSSTPVVTPEMVRRIAELARLSLPESELPLWSGQLGRILGHIDELRGIPAEAFGPAAPSLPTPLRPDVPRDGRGGEALEANAPRLSHGYGVVPRVVGSGE